MKHAPPQPPELGTRDGLSYALFLPPGDVEAGVVVLHGAGSQKESHFDFGRLGREHGLATVAFDARGHGASEGAFGAGAVDDVLTMVELLREHAPAVALRGSSLGGLYAIHAAARDPAIVAAAVACPAPEDLLLRGLRKGDLGAEFEADRESLDPWLESHSVHDTVRELGGRTALLLLHARGDEVVPYTVSEELHAAAGEPKRLIVFPGGHHRSLQHDVEIQNLSARFITDAARARREGRLG